MNGRYAAISARTALAAAVVLCAAGCGTKKVKKVGEREVRVTVRKLEKRVFRRTIPVQGTVAPVEHAVISAKTGGTLEMLKVDEGDTLAKGSVLFGIDSKVLRNQLTVRENEIKVKEAEVKVKESELDIARIAEKSAEASRDNAKSEYDRIKTLLEKNAASKADFEKNETGYKTAELKVQSAQAAVESAQAAVVNAQAQLKQAQSNLDIAKKNFEDSVIVAPFDCTVTDKYVEENEYVSVGRNILKLENHKLLEVECFISAVHYDDIKPGVTSAIFGRGGRAVVTYKAPSIDPESRTFKIKIRLPEGVGLVSGTLCSLKLVLEEKEAYGLPSDAILLRANDRHIAYAVDDKGSAQNVEIERGIIDGKFCEVRNSAKLTDKKFVVTGQTFVNNGARLKVINPEK